MCRRGVLWLLPAAGVEVLKPYQTERLTGFANPDTDPSGLTYNVSQSITAVGAGGLEGRGVVEASQTRLDYLPEHATDFVFASFAEQRGFFGASILLLLYLLVVWRGLRVITVAGDLYGAIVAGGIVFAFLFQVFVNVGMTMGIAPVTGIPLPFVTVGGSSMVANLLAVGVLQSIHARGGRGAAPVRAARRSAPATSSRLARGTRALGRRRRPLVVDGRARESSRGRSGPAATGAVVRRAATRGRGRVVRSSRAAATRRTRRMLRPRARARARVVVQTVPSARFPYVLATDVVDCPPGQGFPVEEIAQALARASATRAPALAARFPCCGRRSAAPRLDARRRRRARSRRWPS